MTANSRSELVDLVTQGIFDQLAAVFPRRTHIDYDELAQFCGVATKVSEASQANFDREHDTFEVKFGEEFIPLVKAMLILLTCEEYVFMNEPSEHWANRYGLSERGAKLRGCLPALLRS